LVLAHRYALIITGALDSVSDKKNVFAVKSVGAFATFKITSK
jgi:hydroxyethylthiazole kinase-like sugar kinase family protein